MTLPNFLFLGPERSGSTWLYVLLREHPQAFVPKRKELRFYEREYARGYDWYASWFKGARAHHRVRADVSPEYLASIEAFDRIRSAPQDLRLMVCLREPLARTYSHYLHALRLGFVKSGFADALDEYPDLIRHSLYADDLRRYLDTFGLHRTHVALFDDLASNAQAFTDTTCHFLGLDKVTLTGLLLAPINTARTPRSPNMNLLINRASALVRSAGGDRLVNAVKWQPTLMRLLYQGPDIQGSHAITPNVQQRLRERFAPDVEALEALTGLPVLDRWGYR